MKNPIIFLIFILCTTPTLFSQGNIDSVSGTISTLQIKQHLEFLANDIIGGRATGSIGAALSAKYIALNLEKSGIMPAGDNSTFYQYIPMHAAKPVASTQLKIHNHSNDYDLSLGKDFLMYGSGDRRYIPAQTPLVFAGYGIIAPEYDYNDYENIDVDGKIVVILEGEPQSNSNDFFEGKATSVYSYPGSKQRLALSRGAIGTIIIPIDELNDSTAWGKHVNEFGFEDVYLAYSVTTTLNLLLNPHIVSGLFENSSHTWNDVISFQKNNSMKSFNLTASLTYKGEFVRRDFIGQNVIGLIEGNDKELKNKSIIISAHYDHLGIGLPVDGDSIYNGAFDNAIGCAVLLELADRLAQIKAELKRSVVLLFVTGEEKGLLGSRYYIDHPVFPLYATAANVNIDGIPFIDKFNSIVAFGYDLSDIKNNIDRISAQLGLKVKDIPHQFTGSETFNRSDQIAFANAGIPSVLIMDGIDYINVSREEGLKKLINYAANLYHSPKDDLSQNINYDAVRQYADLMLRLIVDLTNSPVEPEWNPGTEYRIIRLRSIAEQK